LWSQTCEYALRAITYLARQGDAPVLTKDIADSMHIPHQYLQKILRELVRKGVLTSARGVGGGFRLSRPAAKIRLAEVIEPFDDLMRRTSCPFGNPLCGQSNPCPVHDRWGQVVGAYQAFLASTTVRDLVADSAARKKGTRRR
jgi:Rrf2 family protein